MAAADQPPTLAPAHMRFQGTDRCSGCARRFALDDPDWGCLVYAHPQPEESAPDPLIAQFPGYANEDDDAFRRGRERHLHAWRARLDATHLPFPVRSDPLRARLVCRRCATILAHFAGSTGGNG